MSVDKRAFPRHALPSVRVRVGPHSGLAARNVSATGILVDYPHSDRAAGETCRFTIEIPVFGMTVSVPITGSVVRAVDGCLALSYEVPSVTWSKLLDVQAALIQVS